MVDPPHRTTTAASTPDRPTAGSVPDVQPTQGQLGLTGMDLDECWERLASQPLGRLAINVDGRPHLVPVNHLVRDREILFVSVAGTKVHAALEQPGLPAAFEVDHYDARTETGWSVVLLGELAAVEDDVDHARLELLGRPIWISGVHDRRWLRLVPEHVTGRHLRASPSTP